ncbi:MAG: hypothetical protein PVJ57_05770 [Phycisphaerae bacterium]|jgi:hypothetical protein
MKPEDASFGQGPDPRLLSVGEGLVRAIGAAIDAVPGDPHGPAELARALGIDRVLASRVLKASHHKDPIAALHLMPGPDPLRRFIRGARKRGVPAGVVQSAEEAVQDFDDFIRKEAGGRSALDAMISTWLPERRAAFELRRKQSIFRAISQLKGAEVDLYMCTTLLHPSADGEHLDVAWLRGLIGLHRLRPNIKLRFATRRITRDDNRRQPQTLDGEPLDGLTGLRLDAFCSQPLPRIEVDCVGESVHYVLAEDGFGPRDAHDVVLVEVYMCEMRRTIPREIQPKRHVYAGASVPAKVLLFDALVHKDVFAGRDPSLLFYDTSYWGVADPNDPTRDADRLELSETIQPLGWGMDKFRSSEEPRYAEILQTICRKLGWSSEDFRGYRCRVEYPLYGSQTVMVWDS